MKLYSATIILALAFLGPYSLAQSTDYSEPSDTPSETKAGDVTQQRALKKGCLCDEDTNQEASVSPYKVGEKINGIIGTGDANNPEATKTGK